MKRRIAVGALRGAFAVPFFVLPAILTVDAPDIHGGYRVHVEQALLLAAVGAVGGAAWVLGGPGVIPARVREGAHRVATVVLAAALAWPLARLASRAADRVAAALVVLPQDLVSGDPHYAPGPVAWVLLAGAAGASGARVSAGRPVRPLATAVLVAWALMGTRWVGFGMASPPSWALEVPLWLLLAGIAVRPPGSRGSDSRRPGFVTAAAAGTLLLAVAPPMPLAWGVGALLLGAAGAAGLPRRVASGLRRLGAAVPRELVGPGPLLAMAMLVPVGFMGLRLLPVVGSALASIPAADDPAGYRAFPVPVVWAVVVVWASGLASRLRGRDPRPGVAVGSWVVACLIVASVVGAVLGPRAGNLASIVPAGGALLAALGFAGRGPLRGLAGGSGEGPIVLGPILRAGPPVLGALLGGGLLRILGAAMVPLNAPPLLLVGVGAGLGAMAGLRAGRATFGPPRSALAYALDLGTAGCAAFLPLFGAVAFGVERAAVVVVLGVAVAVAASGRVHLRWVAFAVFYATFAVVAVFKAGPTPSTCAELEAGGGARAVLSRFGRGADAARVEPYDVLPLPGSRHVLVSFKRFRGAGGFLALLDTDTGEEVARVRPGDFDGDDAAVWPERLEWDPTRGRAWVQILSSRGYAMWEIVPTEGTLAVSRRLPLAWEPGNPALDGVRDRLVLSYVPNREATNPLIEAFDLQGLGSVAVADGGSGPALFDMADYAAVDAPAGRYWVPAFSDLVRFALVEIGADDGRVLRRRETFHPSVGLAADGASGRLYLTNSTAGTLEVVATEDLSVRQRLPAGAFPRDLVFDRERARLHVGSYGDGRVTTYDVDGAQVRITGEARVGPLLRGLGLDPVTGRVFAAPGCGVFEIP